MSGKSSIWLIDSTLRDGEQAPGVAFFPDEKIRLARMLDAIGIDEIEAGTPAMGVEECETIRRIVHLGLHARISVWCRALKQDIAAAAQTGATGIHIAFPVSDIQLAAIRKDWEWVNDTLPQMTDYARRLFPYISVGAQDAGRCHPERLFHFIALAEKQGVCRVRIADTVGVLTPLNTVNLIGSIKNKFPIIDLDFHGHNDLGMATANAITAWQSGASSLSVTVNGLGERAGNAALEEILMILSQTGVNVKNKYAIASLYALCRYVSTISGRPIPDGKPVCGALVFSHESGIHTHGTLSNTTAFQPFDGKIVGRESSRNLFGKHSGKKAVIDFLQKQDIVVKEEQIPFLMKKIKDTALKHKKNVSESKIIALCCKIIKNN
ncbi:MAG: homocitrate synthase [Dysgonamonadaceae bacterium]|jgi:homocitrate synthase NifV|nr:homocitrate synthase [Dysgonamonadaceae bacterium]